MRNWSKIRFLVLVCVLCSLTLTTAAMAKTTASYNVDATPILSTATDWFPALPLTFAGFDTSRGKLLQVNLSITTNVVSQMTVTNPTDSLSSGSAGTHILLSIAHPTSLIGFNPEIYSLTFNCILAPGETKTSDWLPGTNTVTGNYNTDDLLALFTTGGPVSFDISTLTRTVLEYPGGNASAEHTTNASATGTLTYTYEYEPVPEPAGLLSILVGLSGLAGLVKIRK